MLKWSKGWDRVWLGDKSFKGCDIFASGRGAAPWVSSGKSPSFVSAFLFCSEQKAIMLLCYKKTIKKAQILETTFFIL